jgi:hypothetical protein
MYFTWFPVGVALSVSNFSFFPKETFFEKELMKTKRLPSVLNYELPKNVCLEEIYLVVQWIMLLRVNLSI